MASEDRYLVEEAVHYSAVERVINRNDQAGWDFINMYPISTVGNIYEFVLVFKRSENSIGKATGTSQDPLLQTIFDQARVSEERRRKIWEGDKPELF